MSDSGFYLDPRPIAVTGLFIFAFIFAAMAYEDPNVLFLMMYGVNAAAFGAAVETLYH